MNGSGKLPLLKSIKFKPSPFSERYNKLNLFDCLEDSPSPSMTELRCSVDLEKTDVRLELRRYKRKQASSIDSKIGSALLCTALPGVWRRSPEVSRSISIVHKRTKSNITESPQGSHRLDYSKKTHTNKRFPLPKVQVPEHDVFEEYFDSLIRNRDVLRNPDDLANFKLLKHDNEAKRLGHRLNRSLVEPLSIRSKYPSKRTSKHAPVKHKTVVSRSDTNNTPLKTEEGEEKLKKKMNHFHREIQRILSQVEEYVLHPHYPH